MNEKDTIELENVLENTHVSDFNNYCKENQKSIISQANDFPTYVKNILNDNKISQQKVFISAGISERYGYKLLSGEKHTQQRDVILRICYAGKFTLQQTQRALKKYGMQELYAKVERDALLMIIFNERPGNIIDVNILLSQHGMEPLRTSGAQN